MRMLVAGGATLATLAAAGCGAQQDYANEQRPAAPAVVSAYISDGRVAISPTSLGAGPIELIVTNQSTRSRELTLEGASDGQGPCTRQSTTTGPINPQGTAEVKVIVEDGSCTVGVKGSGPRGALLRISGKRPSAQNRVLLP